MGVADCVVAAYSERPASELPLTGLRQLLYCKTRERKWRG
jgi:hypothetical protein